MSSSPLLSAPPQRGWEARESQGETGRAIIASVCITAASQKRMLRHAWEEMPLDVFQMQGSLGTKRKLRLAVNWITSVPKDECTWLLRTQWEMVVGEGERVREVGGGQCDEEKTLFLELKAL